MRHQGNRPGVVLATVTATHMGTTTKALNISIAVSSVAVCGEGGPACFCPALVLSPPRSALSQGVPARTLSSYSRGSHARHQLAVPEGIFHLQLAGFRSRLLHSVRWYRDPSGFNACFRVQRVLFVCRHLPVTARRLKPVG